MGDQTGCAPSTSLKLNPLSAGDHSMKRVSRVDLHWQDAVFKTN